MENNKKIFEVEIKGQLQRRIFKANLKGKGMILDPDLKLIIPIQEYTSLSSFADKLEGFLHVSWTDRRKTFATLEYKNVPMIECITNDTFYLPNGWQIYSKQRHKIRNMGWVESDENNNMTKVFNYFVPVGKYNKNSYFKIITRDNNEEIVYLPEYHEAGQKDNGFLIETRNIRSIDYCFDSSIVAFFDLTGCSMDKLNTRGHVISFYVGS